MTVIVGSKRQLEGQSSGIMEDHGISMVEDLSSLSCLPLGVYLYDIKEQGKECDPLLMTSRERGHLAFSALQSLRGFSWDGPLSVLTCPIDKKEASEAGFSYPGQTEYFADIWQGEALMVLKGPRLCVGLVTTHLPLSQVPMALSTDLISDKIAAFYSFLQLEKKSPKLAIAGLNPHASDNGLFGWEEAELLSPAINYHKKQGRQVEGPESADTVFFKAYHGRYDGVLCMYHDQGLAPLKTVHFYDAVNISFGLKHLRVSPDHGPARDLYGKNQGSLESFAEAYRICRNYLNF